MAISTPTRYDRTLSMGQPACVCSGVTTTATKVINVYASVCYYTRENKLRDVLAKEKLVADGWVAVFQSIGDMSCLDARHRDPVTKRAVGGKGKGGCVCVTFVAHTDVQARKSSTLNKQNRTNKIARLEETR